MSRPFNLFKLKDKKIYFLLRKIVTIPITLIESKTRIISENGEIWGEVVVSVVDIGSVVGVIFVSVVDIGSVVGDMVVSVVDIGSVVDDMVFSIVKLVSIMSSIINPPVHVVFTLIR